MPVAAFVASAPPCLARVARRVVLRRRPPLRMRVRNKSSTGHVVRQRFRDAAHKLSHAWQSGGRAERAAVAALIVGVAAAMGATILAFAQVTAAMALFAIPLVLALPVMAALTAAFSALIIALLILALGATLVLAPALAAGAAMKFAAEAALFTSLVVLVMGMLGSAKTGKQTESTVREEHDGDDELRSFDRALHERERGGRDMAQLESWSVDQVVDQLLESGLTQFVGAFERERIDGAALLALSESDIRREFMGARLGDRAKLGRWVRELQERAREEE